MNGFYEFLKDRLEAGGFSTEDCLTSFLPLAREVVEAHAAGFVAPLDGLGDLRVDGVRIWFEEARRQPQRNNHPALQTFAAASRAAVEVVGESRRTTDLDDGAASYQNLQIADSSEAPQRPVFLPGYRSWEHLLEHHDPLTDIFSLGLILASLACGVDLCSRQDLELFVDGRRNLFALNPALHPVLARAILRMTELDRHRRAQDLPALVRSLENYRDQNIEFDLDLARIADFKTKDRPTRQRVVFERLRERLFELSRRNRLLHFQPTMQTVNLTQASVPLSFDIANIRADQLLVWNEGLQQAIVSGKPLSLNKFLNFAEALYLPSMLDHILADSRRDLAEFGFAQLRLAVCFLHWANLKEQPMERFDSPLVLLPVELVKKKGIRDTYLLQPLSTEAEINPVIRHLFKQLYAIELPTSIDLAATTLDTFFDQLETLIRQSEPGVVLSKFDRPRIELLHDKARRKLDQYQRRARITGRGVRSFLNLDYSYDPANYHPLGIRLFAARIRPTGTRLREIIEETPRPRSFVVPPVSPLAEKERSFFSVQTGSVENPYNWNFDLCNITLANFKYRRMSLVRDYEALLEEQSSNPAFDATFSLVPRPVQRELPTAAPLEDRYDVVPCDPTQAAAIEEAHRGKCYIIQGPPGTGKSQTIANLIADYVARGKRVLFVCEKRAAIDVVYARLKHVGISELCCLIHDSQADKKQFVQDLKQTYETFLANTDADRIDHPREALLKQLAKELEPLESFDRSMQEAPPQVGLRLRALLTRLVELRDLRPAIAAPQRERLPGYCDWIASRESIQHVASTLAELREDTVLAHHPLHALSPRVAAMDAPMDLIGTVAHSSLAKLSKVEAAFGRARIPRDVWASFGLATALIRYVRQIAPVAAVGQMALLDTHTATARQFSVAMKRLHKQREELEQQRTANSGWRKKLAVGDVPIALQQSRTFEASFWNWLRPAWWRLRRVLHRSYDFGQHAVRPTWTQVLERLEQEYALLTKWEQHRQEIGERYGIEGDVEEFAESVNRVCEELPRCPEAIGKLHRQWIDDDKAIADIDGLLTIAPELDAISADLASIMEDFDQCSLAELRNELTAITDALDELPDFLDCLRQMASMPAKLVAALRHLPLTPIQIEAAVADRTLEEVYRGDRALARFTAAIRDRQAARLQDLYDQWLAGNAAEIRYRCRQRFIEHVHISNQSATQLEPQEKEFKRQFSRGRRELEHEFGKTMRFRSIRDLVASESGIVVKDLKPVWLMSPLSVSDTLPLDSEHFDVVIFDEASQIPLEEAVPSLFRAQQAIVVGDEMQLPPTNFFSASPSPEEDGELVVDEDGEQVKYDLDSDSFLNHAAKNLPSTMLGWHYRSRSESLISFSNWAFYDGRLLTVPEERLPAQEQTELRITQASDAVATAEEVLQRPISFHRLEQGVYDNRRNRAEADYVAHLVRELLLRRSGRSIGIIAFSEAQQDEIEGALERLAQQDKAFRELLDAELVREEDGQFVGLLVKNLENIQGDERDIILLSVCYGYGPNGKMLMNFGPINKSGGEKRLNVAFSRARHHMVLVSTIGHSDITNEYNDGANCLKNYLRYAEAASIGDAAGCQRVLRSISRWHAGGEAASSAARDPLVEQLVGAFTSHGLLVDRNVGQSHFRCDLAIRRQGDSKYCLGILVDNESYYEQAGLLERDMMRPRLLRTFGWQVVHVLAKDWYQDSEAVLARLLQAIEGGESIDGLELTDNTG